MQHAYREADYEVGQPQYEPFCVEQADRFPLLAGECLQ